jgi:phenylacetate-CoA ligase
MVDGDQARRVATWRAVLERGGITPRDRALVRLPSAWRAAADCQTALTELGALTLSDDRPPLAVLDRFAPTVLVSEPADALRDGRTHPNLADGMIRLVVLTGEPGGSIQVTRRAIEQAYHAQCLDVYALGDLGVVGWSCDARPGGIHLDDRTLSLEVVEPGTDRPVAEGELGELVVTTPTGRVRTGDLVQLVAGACDCDRSSVWAEGGVRGRLSQRMNVRGHDLLPSTIEQIVRRHPAVADFGLRVYERRDGCEVAVQLETDEAISTEGDRARVAAEVSEDLKRSLGIRVPCDVVAPGRIFDDQPRGLRARRFSRQ